MPPKKKSLPPKKESLPLPVKKEGKKKKPKKTNTDPQSITTLLDKLMQKSLLEDSTIVVVPRSAQGAANPTIIQYQDNEYQISYDGDTYRKEKSVQFEVEDTQLSYIKRNGLPYHTIEAIQGDPPIKQKLVKKEEDFYLEKADHPMAYTHYSYNLSKPAQNSSAAAARVGWGELANPNINATSWRDGVCNPVPNVGEMIAQPRPAITP